MLSASASAGAVGVHSFPTLTLNAVGNVISCDRSFSVLTGFQQPQIQGQNVGYLLRPKPHNNLDVGLVNMTVNSLIHAVPDVARWSLKCNSDRSIECWIHLADQAKSESFVVTIYPIEKSKEEGVSCYTQDSSVQTAYYDLGLIQRSVDLGASHALMSAVEASQEQMLDSCLGISETGVIVWASQDATAMFLGEGARDGLLRGKHSSLFVSDDTGKFFDMVIGGGVLPEPFLLDIICIGNTKPALCSPVCSSSVGSENNRVTFLRFYEMTRHLRRETMVDVLETAADTLFDLSNPGIFTMPREYSMADWSNSLPTLPSPDSRVHHASHPALRINVEGSRLFQNRLVGRNVSAKWTEPCQVISVINGGGHVKTETSSDQPAQSAQWYNLLKDEGSVSQSDHEDLNSPHPQTTASAGGSAMTADGVRSREASRGSALASARYSAEGGADDERQQTTSMVSSPRSDRAGQGETDVNRPAELQNDACNDSDPDRVALSSRSSSSTNTDDGKRTGDSSRETDDEKSALAASKPAEAERTTKTMPPMARRTSTAAQFTELLLSNQVGKIVPRTQEDIDADDDYEVVKATVRVASEHSPMPLMSAVVLRDISKEHLYTTELENLRGNLRMDMDLLARPMIATRNDGTILCINDMASELLGWSHQDIHDKSISALLPHPLSGRHESFIKSHMVANKTTISEPWSRFLKDTVCMKSSGASLKTCVQLFRYNTTGNIADTIFISVLFEAKDNENITTQLEAGKEMIANLTSSKITGQFYIVGSDEIIRVVSSPLASLLNYSEDELAGLSCRRLYKNGAFPKVLMNEEIDEAVARATLETSNQKHLPRVHKCRALGHDMFLVMIDYLVEDAELSQKTEFILRRTQSVMDAIPGCVIICNDAGEIVAYNSQMGLESGYSPQDLKGCNVSKLMPRDYAVNHDSYMKTYTRTGVRKVIGADRQFPMLCKDGSTKPFFMRLHEAVVKSHTHFYAFMDFKVDESKEYRSQRFHSLAKNYLEHFRLVQTPSVIVCENKIEAINPSAENVLKYSSSELHGRDVREIFDSSCDIFGILSQPMWKDNIEKAQLKAITKSGNEVPMASSLCNWTVDNRKYTWILMSDVSVLIDQESRIQTAEQQLKIILDNTVDGIIVADENGEIMSFNRSACNMFDYPDDSIIGQSVSIIVPEPYHSVHDQFMKDYVKTGQKKILNQTRRVLARRANGETFNLELHISEIRAGSQRYFTGVFRDVTVEAANEYESKVSQDMMKAVMDVSFTGLFEVDRECRILYHNKRGPAIVFGRKNSGHLSKINKDKLTKTDIRDLVPQAHKVLQDVFKLQEDYIETKTTSFEKSQAEHKCKELAKKIKSFDLGGGVVGRVQGFCVMFNDMIHIGAMLSLSEVQQTKEIEMPRQLLSGRASVMDFMSGPPSVRSSIGSPIELDGAHMLSMGAASSRKMSSQGAASLISARPATRQKKIRTTTERLMSEDVSRLTRPTSSRHSFRDSAMSTFRSSSPGTQRELTMRSHRSSIGGNVRPERRLTDDAMEERMTSMLGKSMAGTLDMSMFNELQNPPSGPLALHQEANKYNDSNHFSAMMGNDANLARVYRRISPDMMYIVDKVEEILNLSSEMLGTVKGKVNSTARSNSSNGSVLRSNRGFRPARAAEADGASDAMKKVLRFCIEKLGPKFGVGMMGIYTMDDVDDIITTATAQILDPKIAPFQALTYSITFSPGIGVVGQAFLTREYVHVPDVRKVPTCPRAGGAAEVGMFSTVAMPIPIGPFIEGFGREMGGVVDIWIPGDNLEETLDIIVDLMTLIADRLGRALYAEQVSGGTD